MKYYHGIAVAPGVAIGLLSVIANNQLFVPRRSIISTQVPEELSRLDDAFERAQSAVAQCRDQANDELGSQYAQIFEAHLLFLTDPNLRAKIETAIKSDLVAAEYAVAQAFDFYAGQLRKLQDATYAERANDINDVKNIMLRELLAVKQENVVDERYQSIVAATFLAPSEAAKLDPHKTLAIVTEQGGRGSHTSIVASALGVPTVVGLGPFLTEVYDACLAIVDGDKGLLILDPTTEVVEQYERKLKRHEEHRLSLESKRNKNFATTPDGVNVAVEANIEFPYEAKSCLELGATGIGLYRTEFLYLADKDGVMPDEEAHFQAYKQALTAMGKNRTTVIRTFDLGADKTPEGRNFTTEREPNPFMGLRSVRLSLRFTDMFRTQLRAILRASVYGKASVMFPLVTTIREWRQAKMIFHDVCEEFNERGEPYDRNIPLGIMVETPATVIMLDQFASEVDFFSLGTNDLLQYTQAVDRSNKEVNSLYAQESPALMRLIKRVVDVANLYGKPLAICGQMSSVPANVPLLLGLGLRALSVAPGMILPIKEICETFTIKECEEIAKEAWLMETADDVRIFLNNELKKKVQSYADE